MAAGIFSNQEVEGGNSSTTAFQGVQDNSKAIRNSALGDFAPLAEHLISNIKSDGEDKADQNLNNLSKSLGNVSEAYMTKQITQDQAQIMQFRIAEKFKDQNPSMQKAIDDKVNDLRKSYNFIDKPNTGTDEDIRRKKAEDERYKTATTIGALSTNEDDPAKIQAGLLQADKYNATIAQLEVVAKQQSLNNAKLEQIKSEHGISRFGQQDLVDDINANNVVQKEQGRQALQELLVISAQSTTGLHSRIADKIKNSPGLNPDEIANMIKELDDDTARVKTGASSIVQLPYMSQEEVNSAANATIASNENLKAQLLNKVDTETFKANVDYAVNKNKVAIVSGTQGPQMAQISALTDLLGPNAVTYSRGAQDTIREMASGAVGTTPLGAPVIPAFTNGTNPTATKMITSRVSELAKRSQSYELSAPNSEAAKNSNLDMDKALQSVFYSGTQGEGTDPKTTQEVLTLLASPEVNAYAVKVGKFNMPENVVNDMKTVFAKAYSDPAIAAFGKNMATPQANGKPLSSLIEPQIQSGKVVLRPKQGMPPEDTQVALEGIKANEKYLPGVTTIVRADATLNNSDDFRGSLAKFSPSLMGIQMPAQEAPQGSQGATPSNPTAIPPTQAPAKPGSFRDRANKVDANGQPTIQENTSVQAPTEADVIEVAKHPDVVEAWDKQQERALTEEMMAQKYAPAEIQKAIEQQRARFKELRSKPPEITAQPYDTSATNQIAAAGGEGMSDVTLLGGATGTEFTQEQRIQLLHERGLVTKSTLKSAPDLIKQPDVSSPTYAEDNAAYIDTQIEGGSYLNLKPYLNTNQEAETSDQQKAAIADKVKKSSEKYADTEEYLRHAPLKELLTINDTAYTGLSDSEKELLTARVREEFVRPDGGRLLRHIVSTALGSDAVGGMLKIFGESKDAREKLKAQMEKAKSNSKIGKGSSE